MNQPVHVNITNGLSECEILQRFDALQQSFQELKMNIQEGLALVSEKLDANTAATQRATGVIEASNQAPATLQQFADRIQANTDALNAAADGAPSGE